MDPNDELDYEFIPFVRVFKSGRVERLLGTDVLPATVDSNTGVTSRDELIDNDTGVKVRLYLPKLVGPGEKLPVLVHYHGGGFCIETAFSPTYHNYLNSLVSQAKLIAVSVEYRRAPEHPLPAAYEDSWAALQWVVSHAGPGGSEPWLTDHADFSRLFLMGDSAGANIAHNMAMWAGGKGLEHGVGINGVVLVHPYFWGKKPVGSESTDPAVRGRTEALWKLVCPSSPGDDDPWINPAAEDAPSLAGLGCKRVLVCVAGKDFLRDRGWLYYEKLGGSGWGGKVEIEEKEGEEHVFHLFKPTCGNAVSKMKSLVSFFNE